MKTNDLSKIKEVMGKNQFQKMGASESKKDREDELKITLSVSDILSIDKMELSQLKKFLNEMEAFVKQDAVSSLTAGQVRTIYSIIYETKEVLDLQLKRPELAFVAAKQETQSSKAVIKFFIEIIKKTNEENFHNIKDFTASFLKYHKLYGKK